MKCWKCGKDNIQDASRCIYCGNDMTRVEPKSEIGKALRQLYDHYGCESLLSNPLLMVNGLGDLVQDSGKFRKQLKVAMDSGIGKLYLEQIHTSAKPDVAFERKIHKILLEDAELSDTAINRLMDSFDEMIGWSKDQQPVAPVRTVVSPPKAGHILTPSAPPLTVAQPDVQKSIHKPMWILIAVLFTALLVGFFIANQSQGWIPVPWATATPTVTPTPTPSPEPSPTPSPTPEPSPTPTSTPEPSPTPTPTPTPSPEPTPTPSPTPVPEQFPELVTAYWNEAEKEIVVMWEAEGTEGPWAVVYQTDKRGYLLSEAIYSDTNFNKTYLENRWMAPGITVRIWIAKSITDDTGNSSFYFDTRAYCDVEIPILPEASSIAIEKYNIPDISALGIQEMNRRAVSGDFENGSEEGYYKLLSEYVNASVSFSGVKEYHDLRFVVLSPSEERLLVCNNWTNPDETAFAYSVLFAGAFSSDDTEYIPEAGNYKVIWYDWTEMKKIGECSFAVN